MGWVGGVILQVLYLKEANFCGKFHTVKIIWGRERSSLHHTCIIHTYKQKNRTNYIDTRVKQRCIYCMDPLYILLLRENARRKEAASHIAVAAQRFQEVVAWKEVCKQFQDCYLDAATWFFLIIDLYR